MSAAATHKGNRFDEVQHVARDLLYGYANLMKQKRCKKGNGVSQNQTEQLEFRVTDLHKSSFIHTYGGDENTPRKK